MNWLQYKDFNDFCSKNNLSYKEANQIFDKELRKRGAGDFVDLCNKLLVTISQNKNYKGILIERLLNDFCQKP